MRRRTKSTERQQEQEEDFAGVAADHSATRKFSSLSGPIRSVRSIFPVPIDERHHRSARRPRVRRLHRPGWIDRQDHPRRRRRFAKRVARNTPIHRAKTSSVTAVKIKVKSSLRLRIRWVGDRCQEPRSRERRWLWTRVFARGFSSSRPMDLRADQEKAASCRGKEALGRRGIRLLAPSTVLSEVLALRSRRSTDRPREACPRV